VLNGGPVRAVAEQVPVWSGLSQTVGHAQKYLTSCSSLLSLLHTIQHSHHTFDTVPINFPPLPGLAHWTNSKGLSAGVQSRLDPWNERTTSGHSCQISLTSQTCDSRRWRSSKEATTSGKASHNTCGIQTGSSLTRCHPCLHCTATV